MTNSPEEVTVGVDVGSSSVKVLAIDSNNHRISSGEVPYSTARPGPGLAVVDAAAWYDATVRSLRICLDQGDLNPDRVKALAVCGPAHNAALLDSSGDAVRPVLHWSDLRAATQARNLQRKMGERLLELTLHPPLAGWTLSQFLWIRENDPQSWRRATSWAVTKDYVAWKLTGELGTDPYDATGTQLFDVNARKWATELLDLLGWSPPRNPPQVRRSTDVLGRITAEASEATGLRQGTPVAVGTGDTLCEALASGTWNMGDVLLKLGSSGNVLAVGEHPTTRPGVLNYPYLDRDRWVTVMATASGAASARWFRDVFLSESESQAAGQAGPSYDLMEQMAKTVSPGAEGLVFHPYLSGERSPVYDPDLRADFLGVSAAHSLSHFVRAVMEGVAMSLRHCVEDFGEVIKDDSSFSIVGGGSRSPVWLSILSDVLARPLHPGPSSAAANGAALLARAMLSGESPVPPDPQDQEVIMPDPANSARYHDLMEIYRDSAASQRSISHRLSRFARFPHPDQS